MEPASIAYRTDLFFNRFDGVVEVRDSYVVIRTPSNPAAYWGNFLFFPRPPQTGDLRRWMGLFDEEFRDEAIRHVAFGWDNRFAGAGATAPFCDAGFTLLSSVAYATRELRAPLKRHPSLVVRPLAGDVDWAAAFANQCRIGVLTRPDAHFLAFKRKQMDRYRRMTDAGLGVWFGGFLENRLVGDLGVFRDGELARFQSVVTDPEFRRRGICGRLIESAARYALGHWAVRQLIIVADAASPAGALYASMGFVPVERQYGLFMAARYDGE